MLENQKKNVGTVLLTGANGGLGSELAYKISENSKRLILIGRNKNSLLKLKKKLQIKNKYVTYKVVVTDLSKKNGINKAISLIKKEKKIDIVINCAGNFSLKSINNSTYTDLINDFHLNLFAPYMISKECSKKMIKYRKGIILNIGSSASYGAGPNTSIYSASKHALLGMSRAFQIELRDKGIKSIFAAPGSIQTKMGKKVKNQDYSTFIKPKKLADLLVSLLFQDSNMIVNEIIINRTKYR